MNNEEVLRIQLTVSKSSSPELYEVLKKAGRYHQCKRIASLALMGLLAEKMTGEVKSGEALSPSTPTDNNAQSEAVVIKLSKEIGNVSHYSIPECAPEMIGNMLDSVGV